MGVCNFLHVLCGVAYGAMTLYVQWQYIFLPVIVINNKNLLAIDNISVTKNLDFYFQINIFQLGFILSVLLTLAAGIFIPFFLIVFPRFLVRQGNKWSKFIIFMLISGKIKTLTVDFRKRKWSSKILPILTDFLIHP